MYKKDLQYYKFCLYGFFKNLRFFDPFLILYLLSKEINFLEIGILYSVREFIIMIMEIPSGVISDALGRRRTLILSFITYIASFVLFHFSSNYISILVAMIAFAFADAFRTGVHKAMIFQYLKVNKWSDYKIDYYGRTRSWSQSGSAVSAIIAATFVYISGDYNIIFIASVIPYVINMILIYTYPKYLEGEIKKISDISIKSRFTSVIQAAIFTVKKLQFIKVLTNLSLYTGYYRVVKDYVQPVIKYFALSLPVLAYLGDEKKIAIIVGVIYSVIYIISATASKNSGRFTNKFSNPHKPMNFTLIIGLIIGLAIGLSFITINYIWAIIGFVGIVLIENLRKPIGIGLVADLSEDRAMATTLSLTSQAKSLMAVILAPILGFFADTYSPGASVALVSIMLLFTIPVFWLRKNTK